MSQYWIETLKFVGDLPIDKLIAAGYREATDFEDIAADDLMEDCEGLLRPRAIRLLKAAREARGELVDREAAAGAHKVILQAEDESARLDRLLGDLSAAERRGRAAVQLRSLGIARVVVDAVGGVDRTKTMKYFDEGSPACAWYLEGRVVAVEEVGVARLHHPRTGQPLSGADVVPWRDLSRDVLVIAAAAYLEGLDAGEGERGVYLDAVRWSRGQADQAPIAAAAATRVQNDRRLRARAEARIDGEEAGGPMIVLPRSESPPDPRRVHPQRDGGARRRDHQRFLLSLFNADELRQLAPEDVRPMLPGAASSTASVADGMVLALEQTGWAADPRWWVRVRDARPRRLGDVGEMASRYGVEL